MLGSRLHEALDLGDEVAFADHRLGADALADGGDAARACVSSSRSASSRASARITSSTPRNWVKSWLSITESSTTGAAGALDAVGGEGDGAVGFLALVDDDKEFALVLVDDVSQGATLSERGHFPRGGRRRPVSALKPTILRTSSMQSAGRWRGRGRRSCAGCCPSRPCRRPAASSRWRWAPARRPQGSASAGLNLPQPIIAVLLGHVVDRLVGERRIDGDEVLGFRPAGEARRPRWAACRRRWWRA